MTDPTPTPDAPAPDLRAEIVRLIREEYDPEPESLYLPHGEWADNVEGVADKILAALRAEREEAQPVADRVAYLEGYCEASDEFQAGLVQKLEAIRAVLAIDDSAKLEMIAAQHSTPPSAHPPATSPGADRPVERALVVVKYAQVLRDKWRTAGQKADSDDFLGAISDVCDAVDQFDFGSGRIERGATSPGAAGDAPFPAPTDAKMIASALRQLDWSGASIGHKIVAMGAAEALEKLAPARAAAEVDRVRGPQYTLSDSGRLLLRGEDYELIADAIDADRRLMQRIADLLNQHGDGTP